MSSHPAEQKQVKIKLNTSIFNDGEKETFELTTFGRYYKKGNSFFLQYEETMEEGPIKSTMKVSDQEALLLRSGAINMRMVFQHNKKQQGRYETPYGTMGLVTRTKRLVSSVNADEKKGNIDILYDLTMHGSHAGTYHLEFVFEEEKG
ncbi:DUF1934 domain-containing protein [Bacillus dakarensis]|uniref:DUF1934 domain-containing protein n=1 Tax=Robertmurraya dakarensis TaxID=1926278 RepID=UPI000980A1AE|nr:DUF1934 domain-containing protein [Bacillus dakarensis]